MNQIPTPKTSIDSDIDAFHSLLMRGLELILEAGKAYVRLLDSVPNIKSLIIEKHPEITEHDLRMIECIGRGTLYHRLAFTSSPGLKRLSHCPFSEQVKYFNEPIPMLLLNGKDETDHLMVDARAIDASQAAQCIGSHVRTLGEQRAWLERKRSRAPKLDFTPPYVISNGRVTFQQTTSFSAAEIALILAKITK